MMNKGAVVVHGYEKKDGLKRILIYRPQTNETIAVDVPVGGLVLSGQDTSGDKLTVRIGYYYGDKPKQLGFWDRVWKWLGGG